MSVRWGILSTARINDWILDATRASDAVDFVAVGGRDTERTRAWAEARGVARAFGSLEEVLSDPDLDAVYISLPNSLHIDWAIAALEAGKHVLCEKPLGRDPERVERAAAIAERESLVLAEAFMYRYHPQTELVRRMVDRGAIGPLRHINATLSFPIAEPTRDPRLSSEMEGGALMDVGCYCVSAMRLFLGEPESAWAEYVTEGGEVDLRVSGLLRFPGGERGQFDAAMTLPRRDRLELVGDAGSIVLVDPWHCRAPALELRRPSTSAYGPPDPDDGVEVVALDPSGSLGLRGDLLDAYRFELEAVSAAILAGRIPEFAAVDAVAQARALAMLDRAAKADVPVAGSTG